MVMYEQQQQQQQQQASTPILALDDDDACSCGGGSTSNSTIPTTTSTLWGSSSWMNGSSSVVSTNNNNNNTMDRVTEMMVMMSAMDYPFGKGQTLYQQHAGPKNHGVDSSSSWCNNTTKKQDKDKDTVVTDSKPPAPLVRPAEDHDVPACAAPPSQKRDALVEQQQHYERDHDQRHGALEQDTSHQNGRHCHAPPPPMVSMTTSRHEPSLPSSARPLRSDRFGPGGRDCHGYYDHNQPLYHHDHRAAGHYHDRPSSMYPSSSSSRRHDHDYHDMYDQQRNNYTSHSLAQRRRVHPTPRDPHYYYYYDNNEEEEDDHRTCYSEPIRPGVPPRPRPPPSRRVPPNHYHPRDEYYHHHHHHHGGPPRQYHSSFSDHDYYESQHDYHRRAVRSVGPPPGSSSRHHRPPLHHDEHVHYAASLPPPPLGPPRGRRPPAQSRARVDLYSTHHQDHAAAAAAAAAPNMIEISPGVKEPLRGARETTQAVHDRFLTRELCLGCNTTLYCIADCLCVMCPNCQFMSPVLGSTDEHDDVHDEHWILQRRGLGLGFTRETLDTILQQQQQQQQQPLERACHPRAAAASNAQRSAA